MESPGGADVVVDIAQDETAGQETARIGPRQARVGFVSLVLLNPLAITRGLDSIALSAQPSYRQAINTR